jgi:hypothetical protein
MNTLEMEKELGTELVNNQKNIDSIFGINLDNDFYNKLINNTIKDFGSHPNFNLTISSMYSTYLFNVLHESLDIFDVRSENYSIIDKLFFELYKVHHIDRMVEIVWNLILKKDIIDAKGLGDSLIHFCCTNRLPLENKEDALLFFFSSDSFGAKFNLNKNENKKLFNLIKNKFKIDIIDFCVYLEMINTYIDIDTKVYRNVNENIKKALM